MIDLFIMGKKKCAFIIKIKICYWLKSDRMVIREIGCRLKSDKILIHEYRKKQNQVLKSIYLKLCNKWS